MSPNIKRLTLGVFGLAALLLVWGGNWYQGLAIWLIALLGLIWQDKRHIERRLASILPKLYVCAKPEEYLEWLEDLKKELLFKNLYAEKLDVYRLSGWLYETGRPHLEQVKPLDPLADEVRTRDPLKIMEKQLLSPADKHRRKLNAWYLIWVEGGESFKALKPQTVKDAIEKNLAHVPETDPQKPVLVLIGKLLIAKWALGHQQRSEAERLFTELRETEVFNLMFGEVNWHLGQIEVQKKQKAKAVYFFRVALNFADGTALEAEIPTE